MSRTATKPRNSILLGRLIGVNMNSTTAQAIKIYARKYVIRRVTYTNASISLTTAVGGVYAEAGASTALTASNQAYSALDAAAKFVDATLQAAATGSTRTEANIYHKLTTPQGAAATADVYVFGDVLE